jgi:hypothetical protein
MNSSQPVARGARAVDAPYTGETRRFFGGLRAEEAAEAPRVLGDRMKSEPRRARSDG